MGGGSPAGQMSQQNLNQIVGQAFSSLHVSGENSQSMQKCIIHLNSLDFHKMDPFAFDFGFEATLNRCHSQFRCVFCERRP